MADEPPTNIGRPDIWSDIRQQQQEFFDTLGRNDPASLANLLCNMCRHDATRGTVQGDTEYHRILASQHYQGFVARLIKDKLVSLAEAIGAIALENPEQGPWASNYLLDIDYLVDRIEQCIGMTITPPPIDGGLLKIISRKGLFHERDLNAIYTAWSLAQLMRDDPAPSLCEIGGGTGRVAYWAHRFGLTNYTIYDLPHITVLQGFYLLKSLPDARIALYGEHDMSAAMRIMPYFPVAPSGLSNLRWF